MVINLIKAGRLIEHVTIDELLEHVSVSKSTLLRIEANKEYPRINVLCEVSHYLKIPISDLIECDSQYAFGKGDTIVRDGSHI